MAIPSTTVPCHPESRSPVVLVSSNVACLIPEVRVNATLRTRPHQHLPRPAETLRNRQVSWCVEKSRLPAIHFAY